MAAPLLDAVRGSDALQLLREGLASEDVEQHIHAMRQLSTVAAAIGAECARMELVPFLSEVLEDDDEVLLVLADELGKFVTQGLIDGGVRAADGTNNTNVVLLAPLATLATVEETVVRDKAVESACAVIRGLDSACVAEHVVPIVKRLTSGDWFTGRVSACGLFAATYARLAGGGPAEAELRKELRQLYGTLCADDTPMVRRAASRHIGSLVAVFEHEFVLSELLQLFTTLASDDPDSVRLLAIENCTAFARVLSPAENRAHVLPLVKACAGDKSWRVRNNVAREFFPLSDAMGSEATRSELLPLFVKLLQDPEGEVRASAARNVAGYAQLVGFERFGSDILPAVREAAGGPREGGGAGPSGDLAQSVRAALAESLVNVAAAAAAEKNASAASEAAAPALAALQASIMPLVLQFLRDEAPEVRLKVLDGLAKVVGSVGPRYLEEAVLPVLVSLVSDPLWRVREKVITQMPLLAEHLGAQLFEEQLLDLFMGTYGDQVNAVRMAATRCLEPLMRVLGAAWMRSRIVPRLLTLYHTEGSSYLQRITVLYGVRNLSVRPKGAPAPSDDGDARGVAEDLLALLLEAPRDPVANVRFVSLQVLADAVASGAYDKSTVQKNIQPVVAACVAADPDMDVRFFAQEASAAL